MKKGQKQEVLIDFGTPESNQFNPTVWADEGLETLISSVDGVTTVYTPLGKTRYSVYIDERYDPKIVAKEIEAALLGLAKSIIKTAAKKIKKAVRAKAK